MKAMTVATEHTNTFPTRFERVTTSNAGWTSPGSGSAPGSAAGGGSSDPLEEVDAVEWSAPPAVLLAGSGVEEFSIVIVVSGLTTASAGMSVRRGRSGWWSRLKNRLRELGRSRRDRKSTRLNSS